MGFVVEVVAFSLLLVTSSAHYILEGEDASTSVKWPSSYNAKVEALDVLGGNIHSYEIWHSGSSNYTRIDYFGGIQKKYYVPESSDNKATLYVLSSRTDIHLKTSVVCYEQQKEDDNRDFLPSLDEYKVKVEAILDGKKVQVWATGEIDKEGHRGEKMLYIYQTEDDYDIPLKETFKVYGIEKGDLETHTVTNYKYFTASINENDVLLPDGTMCYSDVTFGKNFKTDLQFLEPHLPGDLDKAFFSFRRHYNKIYDEEEHEMRKLIFHQNWMLVAEHNRKNLGYKLELNRFADYTDEEFQLLTGSIPPDPNDKGTIPMDIEMLEEDLPESYDLRLEGHLRPVRNQEACGSSWAFTAAAVVEGALSLFNGGRNLDLSEQSMIDCAWGYENYGCNGGQLNKVLQYAVEKGIPTRREYGPYLQIEGVCHLSNMTETYKIRGFSKVIPDNPIALKAALYKYGPVAVAVHAGKQMRFYSSGILYDYECDGKATDHAVVAVGYGIRDNTPYWIIRNSWGESWGQDGYLLISAINNNCHVMDTAYYAVV